MRNKPFLTTALQLIAGGAVLFPIIIKLVNIGVITIC